jgi:hypothetical protein
MHGGFNLGWNHTSSQSDVGGGYSSNFFTGGASFLPWSRLTVSQTATYTTNLSAAFNQSLVGPGGIPVLPSDTESHSLNLGTNSTLNVGHGLTINGHLNHRVQTLFGIDAADTQYGGTLNYNYRSPLFGFMYFGVGVVDTASKTGNDGAGLVADVGMSRRFGKWETSADFNYQQNVQTLIVVATTSTYSYGGSARRRINRDTSFGGSFRGSHSGLVTQEGNGNRSESFGGSFQWRKWSVNGSYSQSQGTAILTSGGTLTTTPLTPLLTDELLLFNARSYSVSLTAQLRRRLSVTGGFVNVFSDTRQGGAGNTASGHRYNARMEYRLRKFSFVGGFNRSMQDISAIGGPTRVVNSYYLSLTRWFNIF